MSKCGDMIVNQHYLLDQTTPSWSCLAGGREGWESTDHHGNLPARRLKYERFVYRLMRKMARIPYPLRKHVNGSLVKIQDETYSERWLVHYYNLRHFQPCRQVASFTAGRMTGEYHEGNDVRAKLDYERLFKAREILNRLKSTVLSPSTKSKGQ